MDQHLHLAHLHAAECHRAAAEYRLAGAARGPRPRRLLRLYARLWWASRPRPLPWVPA